MRSENKKKIIIVSVASLFVVALYIHSKIIGFNENRVETQNTLADQNSRGVASIESGNEFSRNVQWEHELAHELSSSSKDERTASKSTSPNLLERLMSERLSGEYSVRFASGKVKSIEITGDHPVVLKDYISFLNQYSKLWSVSFMSVEQQTHENESHEKEIHLKFFDKNHNPSGFARIRTDSEGHFLSMNME